MNAPGLSVSHNARKGAQTPIAPITFELVAEALVKIEAPPCELFEGAAVAPIEREEPA